MLHANITALQCMFDRTGVIADRSFAGIGIFDLFDSCDLDLDPTTFIYRLDLTSVKIPHVQI